MGLVRRAQGSKRWECRCTLLTTSNAEIARSTHAPFGFRRHGGICGVGAPRRCTSTSPASRRLASAPVALGTRPLPILGRAPKRATEGPADVLDSTSRSPTERNAADMPGCDAAVEAS